MGDYTENKHTQNHIIMSMADGGHSINKSNNLDPDEGNSKLCSACNLPIFATPFIISSGGALLHDQCVDLPKELKGCDLHPEKPLLLRDNHQQSNSSNCSKCSRKCGTKLYSCPDSHCSLILDVACALPVKILHRSHLEHRLIAIRGGDKWCFGTCGVCGVKHDASSRTSYFCVVCGFWVHPKCAKLPYVIQHEKHHEHSLVLYYDVEEALSGAELGQKYEFKAMKVIKYFYQMIVPQDTESCKCAICDKKDTITLGVYSCIDPQCRGFYIHIRCATSTSDHQTFKAVSGRDAKFGDLVRLPIPNEHLSYLEQITKNTIEGLIVNSCDRQEFFPIENIKDEDPDGDGNVGPKLVCDACVKVINKPPFYSCKECPNLLFHQFCRSVPDYLSSHPTHDADHSLILILSRHLIGCNCSHCGCPLGRAFFMCGRCEDQEFLLDVSCALMPAVVTHDEHAFTHFLHLSDSSHDRSCDCCRQSLGELGYECRTCPNFALHTWCAMLPKTVTHKFDPHPLRLITSGVGVAEICEICENKMDDKVWYYGCKECDQWFHIDCIPCLDLVHKIKSVAGLQDDNDEDSYIGPQPGVDYEKGFFTKFIRLNSVMSFVTSLIRELHQDPNFQTRLSQVLNHRMEIPTRLVRGLTLRGHGNDHCEHVADEYDVLASD